MTSWRNARNLHRFGLPPALALRPGLRYPWLPLDSSTNGPTTKIDCVSLIYTEGDFTTAWPETQESQGRKAEAPSRTRLEVGW